MDTILFYYRKGKKGHAQQNKTICSKTTEEENMEEYNDQIDVDFL